MLKNENEMQTKSSEKPFQNKGVHLYWVFVKIYLIWFLKFIQNENQSEMQSILPVCSIFACVKLQSCV